MRKDTIPAKPAHREIELDFIRGIAIFLVLDFHSPSPILLKPFLLLGWPHFGWAGVDIFFVLSGFLVGGLLVKERKLRGRIDTKRFLVRRGFKIWPQYYFFLFVMLVSGHRTYHELWGNFLNIQNYVGGVAHTWTLAVEEHAYLLLVLVLAVSVHTRIRMRSLCVGTGLACCVILVWRFVLAAHGGNVFSRTDTRVDGIFYGVMLAMLYHYAPDLLRRLQSYRWVWSAILVGTLILFRIQSAAWWWPPLSYALADASGVAVLLLLYTRRQSLRSLPYRFVAWIGLYSYGIYLWHVSVIEPILHATAHLSPTLVTATQMLAPEVCGIALGILTTRLIEFPSLTLRDRLFPRRIDSAAGIPAEEEAKLGIRGIPESVS